jgi:hypothetical protein
MASRGDTVIFGVGAELASAFAVLLEGATMDWEASLGWLEIEYAAGDVVVSSATATEQKMPALKNAVPAITDARIRDFGCFTCMAVLWLKFR